MFVVIFSHNLLCGSLLPHCIAVLWELDITEQIIQPVSNETNDSIMRNPVYRLANVVP